ncbi:phytoene/squalene synthase family protein [Nocardia cyriacigeorgica]|uniref:Dehydrosqualene synthase n=1 Tax=Nocardia cyriacigeorgica TaxID=135487 RepID=A0A4U8W5B0_9NOCA|nr:phytoene/squalene synthase family protein [Nocardia cyriacigeorgica]MBF6098377.1 phytoene/squalene synthase family protein [Nocardia cyriacigeorgica]VFA96698.1 Dehydrosqualene synthase [Nocardia cyriacigeorgica]
MTGAESGIDLTAAGPRTDRPRPADATELAEAYRLCRHIAAEHGRTYFLATRLLSAPQRRAVHALYAFARMVDDIVDGGPAASGPLSSATPAGDMFAARIDLIEDRLRSALTDGAAAVPALGATDRHRDAILLAVTDTIRRYGIAAEHFWTFLHAMRMDIPSTPQYRNRYADMAELNEYMRGSAAAIGLQLLPVLGTVVPVTDAEPAAAALGNAFQLTNFLRDIGEDLDRGRVYLPADELAAFGVDDELLAECRRTGRTDRRVRRALAHLIAVNRDLYRTAAPGIELLAPRVRPAIRTAATLYGAILEQIEDGDYAVFDRRAVVPMRRKLRVAAGAYLTGR